MKANNVYRIIIGTALILMVPLVAMIFSDETNWNWFDFAVMGTLLIGSGLIFELVTSKLNAKYRPAAAVVVIGAVVLIWAEMAVGIFGSPIAGS